MLEAKQAGAALGRVAERGAQNILKLGKSCREVARAGHSPTAHEEKNSISEQSGNCPSPNELKIERCGGEAVQGAAQEALGSFLSWREGD